MQGDWHEVRDSNSSQQTFRPKWVFSAQKLSLLTAAKSAELYYT